MAKRRSDNLGTSRLDTLIGVANSKESPARRLSAFSKLLTEIDNLGPRALKSQLLLKPKSMAFRIGITGPPGAGKSTLIGVLIAELRKLHLRVGVLAVDPSSPFSNGAILGDRIRYNHFHHDSEVFIRSLGTRGSLGGLSAAAYLFLRAFDACGFDVVIVETVGVGQTELEVVNVADHVAVVLVPESGDSIQAMKAGLLEIADLFIVNKADRPSSEVLARELENAVALGDSEVAIPVLRTVATAQEGVLPVVEEFMNVRKKQAWQKERSSRTRLQSEARALLRARLEQKAEREVQKILTPEGLLALLTKF